LPAANDDVYYDVPNSPVRRCVVRTPPRDLEEPNDLRARLEAKRSGATWSEIGRRARGRGPIPDFFTHTLARCGYRTAYAG